MFRLGIRLDNRKSRLIRHKLARGYKIVGLLAPRKKPYRWWVNLAEDGMLVTSAMMTAKSAIVVQDGALSLFGWRDLNWKNNRLVARLDRVTVDGHSRQAVLLRSPAGYLASGLDWNEGSFAWEQAAVETPFLDWLDFAGAIQLDFWGARKGLAEAEHEDGAFIGAPGNALRKVDPPAARRAKDYVEQDYPEYALGPLLLSAV